MNLVLHAGSPCINGSVRLIGGLVPTEGTVQMWVGGRWRELCYSFSWSYEEAFVVCRQLGLPATGECVIIHILKKINNILFLKTVAVGEAIH